MKIPAHAKYQIIYDTLQKNDNLLNVAVMCEIAGVSRSGYYHCLILILVMLRLMKCPIWHLIMLI